MGRAPREIDHVRVRFTDVVPYRREVVSGVTQVVDAGRGERLVLRSRRPGFRPAERLGERLVVDVVRAEVLDQDGFRVPESAVEIGERGRLLPVGGNDPGQSRIRDPATAVVGIGELIGADPAGEDRNPQFAGQPGDGLLRVVQAEVEAGDGAQIVAWRVRHRREPVHHLFLLCVIGARVGQHQAQQRLVLRAVGPVLRQVGALQFAAELRAFGAGLRLQRQHHRDTDDVRVPGDALVLPADRVGHLTDLPYPEVVTGAVDADAFTGAPLDPLVAVIGGPDPARNDDGEGNDHGQYDEDRARLADPGGPERVVQEVQHRRALPLRLIRCVSCTCTA